MSQEYDGLHVHGVVGDFERHLERVPPTSGDARIVALLGGTVGNFPPGTRRRFLRKVRALLGPDDRLLLGTDLVKDPAVIEAAYDDPEGVTAEFNRNVLHVINRELGADFVPEAFEHIAFFDRQREWVEMRLRAQRPCSVMIEAIGLRVEFAAGEELRTEISAKFTRGRVAADYRRRRPAARGLVHRPRRAVRAVAGRVSGPHENRRQRSARSPVAPRASARPRRASCTHVAPRW